jgi:hypothetical protein
MITLYFYGFFPHSFFVALLMDNNFMSLATKENIYDFNCGLYEKHETT